MSARFEAAWGKPRVKWGATLRSSRVWAAALAVGGGLLTLAPPQAAWAQAVCAEVVEPACLGRLGAGAMAADESRCNAQWIAYRNCLSAAAGSRVGPTEPGQGCTKQQAAALWSDVKGSKSCVELAAFQEACPSSPEARVAAGRYKGLNCETLAAGAAAADLRTQAALQATAVASPQMVRMAQIELQRLDRYMGAIDGVWGEISTAALKRFQQDKGLTPADGHVTDAALAALRAAPTPEGPRGPKPGDTFRDCVDCPEMIVAPAGRFVMGSPPEEAERFDNEGPQREVQVASFAIGRTEVTRGEWRRFVEATGHQSPKSCYSDTGRDWGDYKGVTWETPDYEQTDEHPVVCVSWEDAQAYVAWLNEKVDGAPYRLPSESEWEYAARAATQTPYPWGSNPDQGCAYVNAADQTAKKKYTHWIIIDCEDGYLHTAPARRYGANGFNIYGMIGNALEFVQDCWNPTLSGAPTDGAPWMSGDCANTVLRGGSWGSVPGRLRSATRLGYTRGYRDNFMGFRVAKTL